MPLFGRRCARSLTRLLVAAATARRRQSGAWPFGVAMARGTRSTLARHHGRRMAHLRVLRGPNKRATRAPASIGDPDLDDFESDCPLNLGVSSNVVGHGFGWLARPIGIQSEIYAVLAVEGYVTIRTRGTGARRGRLVGAGRVVGSPLGSGPCERLPAWRTPDTR